MHRELHQECLLRWIMEVAGPWGTPLQRRMGYRHSNRPQASQEGTNVHSLNAMTPELSKVAVAATILAEPKGYVKDSL